LVLLLTKRIAGPLLLPLSLNPSPTSPNQLTTAKLFSRTKMIDRNVLISIICEESERQKTKRSGHKNGDEAMAVMPNEGKKGGKGQKPKGACWDCGEEGHHTETNNYPMPRSPAAALPMWQTSLIARKTVFGLPTTPWIVIASPGLTVVSESDDDEYEVDPDDDDWFSEVGDNGD
jgi:hypothetical protein